MRLVGATPNFIRLPFITEGLFYSLISVSLSFLMLYLAGQVLGLPNLEIFRNIGQLNLSKIFFTELGISTLLSLISSTATVQQYLKNNLIFS
jgi:cell division protein FtsX